MFPRMGRSGGSKRILTRGMAFCHVFAFSALDFSMSLNRPRSNSSGFDPDLGLIAFGGVVPVATRSPHVTVPSLKVQSEYGSSGYALYVGVRKITHLIHSLRPI